MKIPSLRNLVVATIAVFGFAAGLPASAARADRPPSATQPPSAVSGM